MGGERGVVRDGLVLVGLVRERSQQRRKVVALYGKREGGQYCLIREEKGKRGVEG